MIKAINLSLEKLINENLNINSDAIGAFASGLCMLHCLATPIFFIASACSSTCCTNAPLWWQWMDYLFLAVSFFAIYHTSRSTAKVWVIQGLWVNWAILFFFIINVNLGWFQLAENLKFIPAFALVFLHMYNLRYCQCSSNECC